MTDTTPAPEVMTLERGKHHCCHCGKLIKPGERYRYRDDRCGRRDIRFYWHDHCPGGTP